jgi:HSP20 family molecular chaperone IbpA
MTDVLGSFWDPFDTFSRDFSRWNSAVDYRSFEYDYEGDDLVLTCDVPGVKSEDINLQIEAGKVSLSAQRNGKNPVKYSYSILIPKEYDSDNPEASLDAGVLTVRFKKAEFAKSKKIQIKTK